MGIGKIPDAVLNSLHHHRDLGIHTEMFSDGVIELMQKGIINNSLKSIHRHKTVTSRGDVLYVVTEYGISTLRGQSIRERALELI